MIDASTIPDDELKTSTRMIRDEALKRGWKVWSYKGHYSYMRLVRSDNKELDIFSAVPPTTTYAAGTAANDKYVTNCLQQENGIPVPESYLVSPGEDGVKSAQTLLKANKQLVVKPLDAGHGLGVSIGLKTVEAYREALTFARQYSPKVIVQECIQDAIDIRVTCVNYKMVGSVVRIPAHVTGDGVSTLEQLIERENQSPQRGLNYSRPLNLINDIQASRFLGERLKEVPENGQCVQVVATANLGTGGEVIDTTDELPSWLIEMAEKAAQISRLPVCGVDFLVQKFPKTSDTQEHLVPRLIELNSSPALFLNDMPGATKPRGVVGAYVDYLESL